MDYYFRYTVNEDTEEPIMLIDKHIGYDKDEGYGIMGDEFKRELMYLDTLGKKRIQLWINSPGGIVMDGYDIYSAILKSKTKVDTYCTGIAASIAGVIFQAGRKRIMSDYAILMYHEPFGSDDAQGLAETTDSIATMISSRCGKTADAIKKVMKKTTFMSASQAFADGFCDEIEYSSEANKKRMPATVSTAEEAKNVWRTADTIMNSLFKVKNSLDMKNIANKLGLVAEASEDSLVKAIEMIQNRATKAETDLKEKETELQGKASDLQKKEQELADLKNKYEALEKDVKEDKEKAEKEEKARKEKEAADLAEKAKNLIEGYVNEGRIKKDEAIMNSWIEKAKADYDGIKTLVDSMPLNRKATPIITTEGGDNFKPGSVIANRMTELYVKALS